ncbi:hypothetical protein B0H11DRAFT_1753584 [Mycena galericulata]|nr:hypothetical protein B0H11DRAFT_1753584 [Mycena galericulata]
MHVLRAYSAVVHTLLEVLCLGKSYRCSVLKGFEKVEPSKAKCLTPTASFTGDLGLDSLDVVEAQMAIEEVHHSIPRPNPAINGCRSSQLIPDAEADEIRKWTVKMGVDLTVKVNTEYVPT